MAYRPPPEAVFDVLLITDRLETISGGALITECCVFAYLACLLSVYQGRPASQWGYDFAATHYGAPYSASIVEAADSAQAAHLLDEGTDGVRLTTNGKAVLGQLGQLRRFVGRRECLEAACDSALAIPLPQVGEWLGGEPQIRQALALASTRPLLDDTGIAALHAHFRALAEAVPSSAHLLVAAVTWLSYLGSTLPSAIEDPQANA